MNKPDIVERLLTVEQAYADIQHQFTQLQFELIEIEQRLEENAKQEKRSHGQRLERKHANGITTEPKEPGTPRRTLS
jgi:predicted  nucleic acid-binding Zn-ribbon protein